MPELYHGYSLNEVREDVNWSTREVTFHKDILDKLPNKGSAHTPVSRHGHSQLITESGEDALVTLQDDGDLVVNADLGINADPEHNLDIHGLSGINATARIYSGTANSYLLLQSASATGKTFLVFGDDTSNSIASLMYDNSTDKFQAIYNDVIAWEIDSSQDTTFKGAAILEDRLILGSRTDVGAGGTSGSPTTQSVVDDCYFTVQVSGASDEYYRFTNPTDGQVILVDPKDAGDGPPGSAYFDRDPTGGSPDYVLLDYGPWLIVYTASDSRWTLL